MNTAPKKILKRFDIFSSVLSPTVGRLWDIYSLILLKPLINDFVPWTGVALRPYTALTIINDIYINDRNFIVELGSGISTLLFAQVIRDRGKGKLLSIEDNPKWARFINDELKVRGLDSYCTVLYAPLERCETSLSSEVLWYQEEAVFEELLNNKIDLLLVDGPKASTVRNRLSRFPAVPVFKSYFAESFSIYLDDIRRSGEKEIVEKWMHLMIDCKVFKSPVKGNFSCLWKGNYFYSRP